MSSFLHTAFFLALLFALPTACEKAPRPYRLAEPEGFVRMVIPAGNPLTEEGVALGRRLFFDPILSVDGSLSCAGCHRPEYAFADTAARSPGVGGAGPRNVPSLLNIGYAYTGLFWDGRSATLEEQALHPVSNPLEMGADWQVVESRLRRHPEYPALFRAAFGAPPDRRSVGRALAQYQRTLISASSRFDQVRRGQAAFSVAERRGWEIFFDFPGGLPAGECGHCHTDPLFTNLEYDNNGLGAPVDAGRASVTGRASDRGKFRTPSLRNVALTAPYMHDGRFRTLGEVIDHYASGGHFADNVSPNVRRLGLSPRDRADLVAFLRTLTDTSLLPETPCEPAGRLVVKH